MNLEESNQFVEQMEKNKKKKKNVLIGLMICVIIVILLIGAIGYLQKKDAQELKLFVDDKKVNLSSGLLLEQDGMYYMNVRELANLLGFSYQKGEYKSYQEDAQSCYLRTPYEIVSMNANTNTITKYLLNEEEDTQEKSKDLILTDEKTGKQSLNIVVDSANETQGIFTIDEPIQFVNNELYVSFAELPKIFSVEFRTSEYHSKLNRIWVYSIPMAVQRMLKVAENLGYTEVSNTYENLTAISDDMLVVGNGTNYGVVSLKDGKEVISLKYDNIVYRQNTEEFFVTAENSVGIVDRAGETIIKPTEFDDISNFDEVQKLYLVEKDDKFGIINREGDTVVYAEYDLIGLENVDEFSREEIRNVNLLFDECIPVWHDGKVGMIDIEGNERLKCVYDSFGYVKSEGTTSSSQESKTNRNSTNTTNEVTNTSQRNSTSTTVNEHDSVLTIPESTGIKGIVVKYNDLYGIYDVTAKRLIIPCAYSKIYSKTKSGVTKYYLEFEEKEIDLESFLKENNLISMQTSSQEE